MTASSSALRRSLISSPPGLMPRRRGTSFERVEYEWAAVAQWAGEL